jgi:hypothetical protein
MPKQPPVRKRKKSPPSTRPRKPARTRTVKKTSTVKKTKRGGKTARLAVPIESLSAAQQESVFLALAATLRQKGVSGELTEVLFADETQDMGLLRCPAGEIRRMVCAKNANGVVVCAPRCVKLPV